MRLCFLALFLMLAVAGCDTIPTENPPPPPDPSDDREGHRTVVTVVEGSLSAPNEAERRASMRAADLLTRHLTGAGLSVRRMTDDAVIREGLQDQVAFLAYHPVLPVTLRNRMAAFVRRGGKLVVFYSSDPDLAALLGFKLGPPHTAPAGSPWNSLVFEKERPALVPKRLHQSSRLARPALPASADARVVAWWETSPGDPTTLPAWTISIKGAWMSHVLQDGDTLARRNLSLGLAAHFDPAVWRTASRAAVRRSGAMPPYPSFTAMLDVVRAAGEPTAPLEEQGRALTALHRAERYFEAIEAEQRLAKEAAAACAATARPKRNEFRGVWNSSGLGLYEESGGWRRTMRLLSARGLNAVFPYAASAGAALYPSAQLPQTAAGKAAGDPLADCLDAARAEGLAVHAWKICWNLEGAPPERIARLKAAGRLQVTAQGGTLNWLCPSRTDNVESELAILEEIARRYAVQGIHLDYIRYPEKGSCYCASCRAGFEKSEGRRVAQWPADVLKSPLAERYARFRTAQITRFVGLARRRLEAIRPDLSLSAAVYGWYPGCIASLGQDWGEWLETGTVDFVCPMNYTENATEFEGWLRKQLPLAEGHGRILPGIGATSTASRLNGLQALEQIQIARRAGAAGFVLYDLNHALEIDVLPLLAIGATAPLERPVRAAP